MEILTSFPPFLHPFALASSLLTHYSLFRVTLFAGDGNEMREREKRGAFLRQNPSFVLLNESAALASRQSSSSSTDGERERDWGTASLKRRAFRVSEGCREGERE